MNNAYILRDFKGRDICACIAENASEALKISGCNGKIEQLKPSDFILRELVSGEDVRTPTASEIVKALNSCIAGKCEAPIKINGKTYFVSMLAHVWLD